MRDEIRHRIRHLDSSFPGFLAEDRDARFKVGRLDIGDEPPLKPRHEALLKPGDVFGGTVARDDNLLVRVVERVKRVEKLLLGCLLLGDEVDVVHEEDIDGPVAAPEFRGRFGLDRGDELVGETLAGNVDDPLVGPPSVNRLADGVHEMGLPQSHAAVDEERVIRLRRRFGHRQRGCVGEPVALPDDKPVERQLQVQPMI